MTFGCRTGSSIECSAWLPEITVPVGLRADPCPLFNLCNTSLNTRIDANPQGAFGLFASDFSLIVLPAAVPASDYSRHTPYFGGVSQISGSPSAENGRKEGEHTRLVVRRWSEDGRSATSNPGSSEFSPNRDARLGV